MQDKSSVIKLIRIAAVLLLVYIGLLAMIDYVLHSPSPMRWFMYVFDIGTALLLFGLTFLPGIQIRLGKAFLPLVIFLVSALPTVFDQVVIRYLLSGPLPSPEATLFRVVPFLLIALILVAWQYRWQPILIFIVLIGIVNTGIVWLYEPGSGGALSNGLFAVMTQVFAFLVVGLFISVMVRWLQEQKRSLEEANAKLTNYYQTLEDLAVTRERSRIAQELHDTLSHTLSGLSVQLETAKAYWKIDPETARKRLDKSLIAVRSGLEETRRILMALRAKPLEKLGLQLAIKQIAGEAANHAGIAIDLAIADNIPALSPLMEQCIFRIAQEAITNVIAHARAKLLTVKLEIKENRVSLTVQDNGTGFDINTINREGHFGLIGMEERVKLVKGELNITSRPGAGTIVQLVV